MAEYIVTRKSDGAEVLRYSAAQAQEVNGFDLVDYDHTEWTPEVQPPATANQTLTKLEYLRRFTVDERVAIRAAAEQNPVLADYLQLMELATEIDTADPDTVSAVTMLEQLGLIDAGRAKEIPHGE
ncbi:MAG: hypothetical protein ACK4FP_05005 [Azonexus sp.]